MGDTTSPALDLFMTLEHFQELEMIMSHYTAATFLFSVFPKELLTEVLKINLLRARWAQEDLTIPEELTHEAFAILGLILDFSPAEWAWSKPGVHHEDRLLVGTIHYSAVSLYCICSLQSLFILPHTPFIARLYIGTTGILYESLAKALKSQKFRKLLLWPLVVLGVAAVDSDENVRSFVRDHLVAISRSTGIHAPVVAKRIIEKFWASGKKHWDDCFDEPYMFVHYGGQGLDLKNISSA